MITSTPFRRVKMPPIPVDRQLPVMYVKRRADGHLMKINVTDYGKTFPGNEYEEISKTEFDTHLKRRSGVALKSSSYTADEMAQFTLARLKTLPEIQRIHDVDQIKSKDDLIEAIMSVRPGYKGPSKDSTKEPAIKREKVKG